MPEETLSPTPAPAPKQTPAPDPLAAIKAENDALKLQLNGMSDQLKTLSTQFGGLVGHLQALESRKVEEEVPALDVDKLKELPMAEVVKQVSERAERVADIRAKKLLTPFARDLFEVKSAQEETSVRQLYPNFDYGKHRDELRQMRISYPDIPTERLVRMVADPSELAPASPPKSQDGARHMEVGPGAATRPSQPAPQGPKVPVDTQINALLVRANEAQRNGNVTAGEELINQALALRLQSANALSPRR